jgi:hypothetical protein
MEYVWEIEWDRKDNVIIRKCTSLLEGGSWTSLADSLPRPKVIHGENNQTSEGSIDDSNRNVEGLVTNQHGLGGYSCGKPN